MDSGPGSKDFHRLDLRSSATARSTGEGSASADATCIAAAKKKNDRIDANKIADCLRYDFLPECHMASSAIWDRLMETGASYNKQRLL
jgi:hypothetical protein